MSDLEDMLKNVVLGSVGAVATVVEKGSEMAKTFVEKGEETVRQGQACTDELKRKVQKAYDEATNIEVDVTKMTREQRDELRRQLDMMDKEPAAPQDDDHADI